MTFENVRIVDPYAEKGSAPARKLTLAAPEDVGIVEAKLKLTFPTGYREFVTTFGKGEYCGHNTAIRVEMPFEILSGHKEFQLFLEEFWFWECAEDVLPKEKAIECIKICDNDVGDVVIFHPSNPNELFVLPHEDDFSHLIGTDLYQALDWLFAEGSQAARGTERSLKRRMFVPNDPHYRGVVVRPDGFYE